MANLAVAVGSNCQADVLDGGSVKAGYMRGDRAMALIWRSIKKKANWEVFEAGKLHLQVQSAHQVRRDRSPCIHFHLVGSLGMVVIGITHCQIHLQSHFSGESGLGVLFLETTDSACLAEPWNYIALGPASRQAPISQ